MAGGDCGRSGSSPPEASGAAVDRAESDKAEILVRLPDISAGLRGAITGNYREGCDGVEYRRSIYLTEVRWRSVGQDSRRWLSIKWFATRCGEVLRGVAAVVVGCCDHERPVPAIG
jgi:hypothetical protein